MTNHKQKLSPFDQAMQNIGTIIFNDPRIKESQQQSLTILLGKLTFESKQPREKRNLFNIKMALRDLERMVQRLEFLEPIWTESKQIFQLTLLQST